jgi:hypothetical protein
MKEVGGEAKKFGVGGVSLEYSKIEGFAHVRARPQLTLAKSKSGVNGPHTSRCRCDCTIDRLRVVRK